MTSLGGPAFARLFEPSILDGLGTLALRARTLVEGFFAGRHLDARPGVGVEFSQYRPYQPGDDLRRVDWRVFGRSDRMVIREADVERDVTVRLVLDTSASMAYVDSGTASKLDYARLLVACLAYLATRQGDRVAAHLVSDESPHDLTPDPRGRDLERLCARLESTVARGRWPPWPTLMPRLEGRQRQRQMVVLVGDLYQQGDEMLSAVRALTTARHEVLVLHLIGRRELELDWRGDVVFEDLETGARVRADADGFGPRDRARFAAYLDDWRNRLLDLGAEHHLMITDQPIDRALEAMIARRRRLP